MNEGNKLHQLLAVEKDLSAKAAKILSETITTFTKKQEHFDGLQKLYHPFEEGGEEITPDLKEVVTTVSEKIQYTQKSIIEAINATISKEETNAKGSATAELKIDNISFGNLSSTSLLALEKILIKIREIYDGIPTLDPTKVWTKDDTTSQDIYRTQEEIKIRTNKIQKPLVLYAATKEHPAQVQMISEDKQVGKYGTIYKSGRIQPAEKSILLERIDKLTIAIKKTRAIANQAEVINSTIGLNIFTFINKDII